MRPACAATRATAGCRRARCPTPSRPVARAAGGRSGQDRYRKPRGTSRPRARPAGAWSVARADLVEDSAIGKELRLGLAPVAEHLGQGERLYLRKLCGVLRGYLGRTRTIEVACLDVLGLGRVEELQIGIRDFARAAFRRVLVDDGYRWLGENRDGREDDVELVTAGFLLCEQRFIFPGDEYVTDAALDERRRGAPSTGVEYGDVLEERLDEGPGLVVITAGQPERVAPGGEEIPAGAAGCLGIGGDDLDPVLDQVAPVANRLRVTLADQEDDGRRVG